MLEKILKLNHLPKKIANYLTAPDRIIPLKKQAFLFQQGEPVKELYVLLSGKIMVGKTSPDGRELTLRLCGAGDLVGEIIVDDLPTHYLVDAKVTEPGEVAVFNQKKLNDALISDPEAMLSFLNFANVQYRKDQTKFRDLVLHGKKGALYSTLIRLSNSYGKKKDHGIYLDINLTNQELANFCATSRESVNRLLNELKRQNIIDIDQGRITILNLRFLKKAINCENCPIVLCTIN